MASNENLYQAVLRNRFVKELSARYKTVDCGGACMNNVGGKVTDKNAKRELARRRSRAEQYGSVQLEISFVGVEQGFDDAALVDSLNVTGVWHVLGTTRDPHERSVNMYIVLQQHDDMSVSGCHWEGTGSREHSNRVEPFTITNGRVEGSRIRFDQQLPHGTTSWSAQLDLQAGRLTMKRGDWQANDRTGRLSLLNGTFEANLTNLPSTRLAGSGGVLATPGAPSPQSRESLRSHLKSLGLRRITEALNLLESRHNIITLDDWLELRRTNFAQGRVVTELQTLGLSLADCDILRSSRAMSTQVTPAASAATYRATASQGGRSARPPPPPSPRVVDNEQRWWEFLLHRGVDQKLMETWWVSELGLLPLSTQQELMDELADCQQIQLEGFGGGGGRPHRWTFSGTDSRGQPRGRQNVQYVAPAGGISPTHSSRLSPLAARVISVDGGDPAWDNVSVTTSPHGDSTYFPAPHDGTLRVTVVGCEDLVPADKRFSGEYVSSDPYVKLSLIGQVRESDMPQTNRSAICAI